ncbi:hypothetical protein C8F04DRAFT_1283243 [Mycena alexandri]|uniref:Uncharacterized protein n=1 Tax=Mycena alexandri TaxID=1745969 RepID=A0AAD6RWY4_9AGAR|nr:hypothetical protein C8F04DRAFT_1283243 [Mycena alexandri]
MAASSRDQIQEQGSDVCNAWQRSHTLETAGNARGSGLQEGRAHTVAEKKHVELKPGIVSSTSEAEPVRGVGESSEEGDKSGAVHKDMRQRKKQTEAERVVAVVGVDTKKWLSPRRHVGMQSLVPVENVFADTELKPELASSRTSGAAPACTSSSGRRCGLGRAVTRMREPQEAQRAPKSSADGDQAQVPISTSEAGCGAVILSRRTAQLRAGRGGDERYLWKISEDVDLGRAEAKQCALA